MLGTLALLGATLLLLGLALLILDEGAKADEPDMDGESSDPPWPGAERE